VERDITSLKYTTHCIRYSIMHFGIFW